MCSSKLVRSLWSAVILFLLSNVAMASPEDGMVARILTLSDLGLSQHISLNTRNYEQHFYFPLPQDARLSGATFEIHGVYQHPFSETAAITLLANGKPVYTHRLPQLDSQPASSETGVEGASFSVRHLEGNGDEIGIVLPLRELQSPDGFLDIGIVLSSQVDATHCIDERGRGNELTITPKNTQLTYSFEAASVQDIRSLLTTLPHRPIILLPKKTLNAIQYSTALRLSQALSSIGLQPEFLALPQPGDTIDTAPFKALDMSGMALPPGLAEAIAHGMPYKISQPAETGIWLALRILSANGLAHAVIDSTETRKTLQEAVQAAGSGILGNPLWGRLRLDDAGNWLAKATTDKNNIRMSMLSGQPVLVLDGNEMGKGVDLIATAWRRIAVGRELALSTSLHMPDRDSKLPHLHFAHNQPVQNVAGSAEWVVPIRLNRLPTGQWPDSLELNLMATPSGDGLSPVVSVFMNDNLLTALTLRTDGEISRLRAHIPLYSLRMSNMVRVEIRRRIQGGLCSGATQSFPVQLLPSSVLNLRKAPPATQFFMLGTKFSENSEVAVPARYLQDAVTTLPVVDSVLRGLSSGETDFRLVADAKPGFKPSSTFVSFESPPDSDLQQVATGNGRLVIHDKTGKTVFDSAGLGTLAVMQLIQSGKQEGVNVITVDGKLPALRKPLELSLGNLAIADAEGVRLAISLDDPENDFELDEENRNVRAFIWRYRMWLILAILILMPVTAILSLRWYYRNYKNKDKE